MASIHDVVHLHGLWDFPILAAASACWRMRTPYILTLHGMLSARSMSEGRWKKRAYLAIAGARILEHAVRLHFTSEMELANLALPEHSGKAFVCPFGVDPHETPTDAGGFRRRHCLLPSNQVVLFLGRLHPQKRPHLLVDAFETVAHEFPQARLVFVGQGETRFVRDLVDYAARKSPDKVVFTGGLARDEVSNAYAAADVFALPSREESFGLAVLEAVAAGRPVIVTAEVGLAASIEKSGCGLVAEADAASIGRALGSLLRDPEGRARMAGKGRELARTSFAWEAIVARLDAEYLRALQG